jgi:hypothetical protein
MNLRLILAASLSTVLVAGTASAEQPWLQDRRYGEGIGLRAGRFEFHPSLSTEVGYDSNYFQRADTTAPNVIDSPPPAGASPGGVVDAWRFRVTPSLTLKTVSEGRRSDPNGPKPMFEFQANTFASFSQMFGNSYVSNQRTWDLGVGGKMDIAPKRPLGADVYGDFVRNGEPSNLPGLTSTFDRGVIRGGAGVTWRPGGGLFDWRLGYEAQYAYFEQQPYTALQNVTQSIVTNGRWRILPRSGFVYDARYTFIRYTRSRSPQPDGDDVQARLGFTGLVTNRISFLVMGGWNSTFYEKSTSTTAANPTNALNYDGYVAQAELKYFVQVPEGDSAQVGLSAITAGFTHDVNNSYLGAFYTRDRGYAGFDYFLGGVFVTNIQGGYSRYQFPATNANNGAFNQGHVDVSVFGEYRLSDIVGINATFLYDRAIGKGPNSQGVLVSGDPRANPPTALYDDLEYQRFQAYLGLRLFW